jgi:endo-1,3-1,4-beta-glycanase ExoK
MKVRMRVLPVTLLLFTGCLTQAGDQASGAAEAKSAPPEQPGATLEALFDELDQQDPGLWEISDGYSNGPLFHCGWRKDKALFEKGTLILRMDTEGCPDKCSGKPYASGEYQSKKKYGFGRYEVRMKPAKLSGTMSGSLFTYNADPQDEIDIEFLGKDTTILQTNYFSSGVGQHGHDVELGFDATADFHDYAFEWRPDSITWFVDGKPVHREDGSRGALPKAAGSLVLNIWPGHTVDSWLGPLKYEGKPVQAEYQWVKFTPLRQLGAESAAAQSFATGVQSVKPKLTGDAFIVDDFEGGGTAKNGAVWIGEFDKHNMGTTFSPQPFAATAGGAPGSPANAGRMFGHLGPSRAPWPYAVLSIDLNSPARPVDVTEFKALEFWAKGDGKNYRVQLSKASVQDWSHPQHEFRPAKTWTKVTLPLARFAQPSWGVKVNNLGNDVNSIVFGAMDGDQDFDLWIDDVKFVK